MIGWTVLWGADVTFGPTYGLDVTSAHGAGVPAAPSTVAGMPVPAEPSRTRADACPGALSTHQADDGELARVRLPGGLVSSDQLRALADCADQVGDGALHLTSRGNVQLRGLSDPGALAVRLADAGLLPSASHERVRNILASPLGGRLDVLAMARELDRALCARAELATLPGRFLFALDAGVGDVAAEGPDVCWRALDSEHGALILAGADSGLRVPTAHAVHSLLAAAQAFLGVRGTGWRVSEVPGAAEHLADVVRQALPVTVVEPVALPEGGPPLAGVRGDAVVAAPPLGVLSGARARRLAALAPEVIVTPWRTLVLAGGPGVQSALLDAGLVLDPAAAEPAVSACVGRPGCAKSRADVRADATRAMSGMAAFSGATVARAHFSGCERRCGRPRRGAVDVLADDDGYLVDGVWMPVDRLASTLARKG